MTTTIRTLRANEKGQVVCHVERDGKRYQITLDVADLPHMMAKAETNTRRVSRDAGGALEVRFMGAKQ